MKLYVGNIEQFELNKANTKECIDLFKIMVKEGGEHLSIGKPYTNTGQEYVGPIYIDSVEHTMKVIN